MLVRDRTSDDPLVLGLEDGAAVDHAVRGAKLGDASEPNPIRVVGGESAPHEIVVVGSVSTMADAVDARAAQKPCQLVAADPQPLAKPPLRKIPRCVVDAAGELTYLHDQPGQVTILTLTRRRSTATRLV